LFIIINKIEMDSSKFYQAKVGYTPLPTEDAKRVEPELLKSSAPYMPLYDSEFGINQVHPSYPVPEPPRVTTMNLTEVSQAEAPQIPDNFERKLKMSKRKMMQVVRVMRLFFVLKVAAIIFAAL
jgi:hypothetical protein